jgi:hypothetical protein
MMFPSLARTPVLKNIFRRDVFARAIQAIDTPHGTIQDAANLYESQSIKEPFSVTT